MDFSVRVSSQRTSCCKEDYSLQITKKNDTAHGQEYDVEVKKTPYYARMGRTRSEHDDEMYCLSLRTTGNLKNGGAEVSYAEGSEEGWSLKVSRPYNGTYMYHIDSKGPSLQEAKATFEYDTESPYGSVTVTAENNETTFSFETRVHSSRIQSLCEQDPRAVESGPPVLSRGIASEGHLSIPERPGKSIVGFIFADDPNAVSGGVNVAATMHGRVVKVMVEEGASVKKVRSSMLAVIVVIQQCLGTGRRRCGY
eukprot:GHVQ01024015.1.p1 GENE.GHVQ01024015.1~~GHVQ01024015.1.p1  ORF type:complete len:253 (-),score=27.50 GHVQ01024015.1:295-1053(-)